MNAFELKVKQFHLDTIIPMQKTRLYEEHLSLGAKMVSYSGFLMPVEYSGITAEHMAVRHSAGMFDVSHMGEFWVKGPGAFAFLQKITSNNVAKLSPGKAQYSCFPNGKGGIVDDLLVYQYSEEKYLLVVNAGNIKKDWDWCVQNNDEGAELENASDRMSLLAVQGPYAAAILQNLTPVILADIPSFSFVTGTLAGIDQVMISHTGYTGAGGFELYVNNEDAPVLWRKILEAGRSDGLIPAGLGARDTLRLEMGFCLYGNDIDESTSPIEAGLGWITSFKDNKVFIDKERLWNQKQAGVERQLKGFVLQEKGIPRNGYDIVDANGHTIGKVTSGTMSPVLKRGIGLGYVSENHWKSGSEIFIRIRNKDIRAQIVRPPFI
ncbi:glycine cleavage system aminomethyltransferase GcvT [Geofilum rubicundum]|uniref:Aminomethyltransferase n=1 Tax=Geofilum rubicundum JCM 15548 TaxID=1236989 RepID=A0A0E9LUU9_9BACT|nr:glycine cleavage system aminomethyltransferase GcvT [Geofilum rubicundum]GAO28645.1 aminomethyltransferase [Geofilum rubicundum JCM 15548]